MSKASAALKGIAFGIAMTGLSGCAYDYLQHTDRVGYSTGDAVKANLEAQTTDPSNAAMYDTDGLGKDGAVVPPSSDGSSAGPSQATPDTASAPPSAQKS